MYDAINMIYLYYILCFTTSVLPLATKLSLSNKRTNTRKSGKYQLSMSETTIKTITTRRLTETRADTAEHIPPNDLICELVML